MNIQPDDNQVGQTGDLVPSNLGARGQKHYVSPKLNLFMSLLSSWPFNMQSMSPNVTLKASESVDFDKNFKWDGATPIAGTPHKATVSRMTPGRFRVKIKNKATGNVVDELNVWIVWSEITPSDANIPASDATGDKGAFFLVRMGFDFTHAIKPSEIITASDRPDLSGVNATAPQRDSTIKETRSRGRQ
ncbi:MAG: hypothetical protein IPL59_26960 [Candidatus Competibacteraceae bacterium]|nr:hypothetical protein [Candidatus Competibacteraceae bacterium]